MVSQSEFIRWSRSWDMPFNRKLPRDESSHKQPRLFAQFSSLWRWSFESTLLIGTESLSRSRKFPSHRLESRTLPSIRHKTVNDSDRKWVHSNGKRSRRCAISLSHYLFCSFLRRSFFLSSWPRQPPPVAIAPMARNRGKYKLLRRKLLQRTPLILLRDNNYSLFLGR